MASTRRIHHSMCDRSLKIAGEANWTDDYFFQTEANLVAKYLAK